MRVVLKYASIYHDMRQLTYRWAEPRYDSEKQAETKDLAQFGDNDSDKQLGLRLCYTGTAKLRLILKDYISKKTEEANDELTEKESWGFNFKTEIADSHALAEWMHWFVVRYALYEWAKMFSASDAKAIKQDLDEMEDDLENLMEDCAWPVKDRSQHVGDDEEVIVV